jgi:hypothetical protein
MKQWLHDAASRKVAGLSPDEVGFLNRSTPSSRTVALGSTQPLTEMSTRNRGVSRIWKAGYVPWTPLAGGFWFVWVYQHFRIDTFLLILMYVYISVY